VTQYIAILKAKISDLAEAQAQNDAAIDAVIQKRCAATDPAEQIASSRQAGGLFVERSRIAQELHTTRRLLARTEGDEFGFDASSV